MALLELHDAAHRAPNRGYRVHIISFDASGALDGVSHINIMSTPKTFGVDGHTRRVIHGWLRGLTVQVTMKTAVGSLLSAIHPISKGLPQEGAPSPFLWLPYFNSVSSQLRAERRRLDLPLDAHTDALYADDVTTVTTAGALEELARRANLTVLIM